MRVLFALPGLHRVSRGAEVAFESIAQELSGRPGVEVTLIGSGADRGDRNYRYLRSPCIDRHRFRWLPALPLFRSSCVWEELSFAAGLWLRYRPEAFDVTVSCSYPFVNWILSRRTRGGCRPRHVHVTQNGDWHVRTNNREYRYFRCDGLVCTNNEYDQRHRGGHRSVLIPNGVDPALFRPGDSDRRLFGLPEGVPVVLMVSALISSKRIMEGIEAVAAMPDSSAHLVVAGDGPMRGEVEAGGRRMLGARFHLLQAARERMPALYRGVDVFLHMSKDEPSSNACIEALASGLPIVAHDRAVTRWTFEDQAVLVDTDHTAEVAAAIPRALAMRAPRDVEARRALVGRRFVWSAIADRYLTFFRELTDESAAPIPTAATR